MAHDSKFNVIIAGWFDQTVDFDPGPAKDRHASVAQSRDVFVTKLRQDGSYRWTRTFGGPQMDTAWRVAVGPDDGIYLTGEFRDTVDFDPGPGEDVHQSAGDRDIFITKFSKEGDYEWTHTAGSQDQDVAHDVAVDGAGNVYVTGGFTLTVDFDRRGAGDTRESLGYSDVFVTKRGPDGAYHWTRAFGGTQIESGFGIDVDETGLLVVGGNYSGTVDFDFTEGVDRHTALGGRDAFLTWMTTDGSYHFTDVFGGADASDGIEDLDITPDGSVVACGSFASHNVDFDPTSGEDLHSTNGDYDFFVTKYYRGTCAAVEGHKLTPKTGKILGEVYAKVPGGRATVQCIPTDPPGEPVKAHADIDGDNMGKYKLKNLKKGEYACAITEVRDADGKSVCAEPAGKRTVTVK